MKIKRVKCDQFAGLKFKDLEFDEGLNIVVGENESGKSTIVDLIYQLLFKDIKLHKKRDSAFIERYFPRMIDGTQGDVIDGELVFETPAGTYKLKKEWEVKNGTCRLIDPDGTTIKGKDAINDKLTEELKHRAGVYSEIVFASQKRKQIAIESIMSGVEKKEKTGKDDVPLLEAQSDLTSTLTQVVLETGGVSIEKIEKAIKKNMDDLIGRWDWNADAPEDSPKRASYKNPWTNGKGTIVNAYYEMDEVRSKQQEEENAERAVETEKAYIQELQKKKTEAEEERMTFQNYRGTISQSTLLLRLIENLKNNKDDQEKVLEKWPENENSIVKAINLRTKQEQAKVHDLYLKAKPVHQLYIEGKPEFDKLKEIDLADLNRLRKLTEDKQSEERKLTGMNLAAKIDRLGSADIIITSVASGEELDLADGEIHIKEAVNISIPGIMDMQLLPEDIDVDEVIKNIAALEKTINSIYEKYGVNSVDALQEKSDVYSRAMCRLEGLKIRLDGILLDCSWEELKTKNDAVPADIETEDEINQQIRDLCGDKTIDEYIGELNSTLSYYKDKYESLEKLKKDIVKLVMEIDKNQKELDSIDEIPEKYKGIDDLNQFDFDLQKTIHDYKNLIEDHYTLLNDAIRKLGDKSAEEYAEELLEKAAVLKARKAEYEHWMNINNVFRRLKEQTAGNQVEDIEEKFREYLGVIADGNLYLNSMDEKMSVQLASGPYALTYDILSDGTKDTISLAFRLAMLEHLYPEGDGLAVFDDPFTDMDAKRVEQSCKLIQKFAENNQVIFVTCDHKYQDYLSGNVIIMER